MKRTVKAWALVDRVGDILPYSVRATRSEAIQTLTDDPVRWRSWRDRIGIRCVRVLVKAADKRGGGK